MINLDRQISLRNREDRELLANIQGNILKGHGRQFSAHIFVCLSHDASPVRNWISTFAANKITTALKQAECARHYRLGSDGGPFASLAISYTGYKKLNVDDALSPSDKRFRYGMKAVRNSRAGLDPDYILHDVPVNRWETHYQSSVDMVVVLADDDLLRLRSEISLITAEIEAFGTTYVEHGAVIRRNGKPIEHFGYVDGISQPLFFQEDSDKEIQERGAKSWNPAAPLKIVLAQDFLGADSYGSYLVFRKLEQNVRGFEAAVTSLAKSTFQTEDRAASLVVGRTRDGIPLVPSPVIHEGALPNDFKYDRDVYGLICPYHAHIRKANPRGDIVRRYQVAVPEIDFHAFERNHRLARRGVTYGDRPDLIDPKVGAPKHGVGLLFIAHTASIFHFEQLQTALDDENFVTDGIGVDPLAGFNGKSSPQRWPTPNANIGPGEEDVNVPSRSVTFAFGIYVTLKGGEYLYSPSIPFLNAMDRCNGHAP